MDGATYHNSISQAGRVITLRGPSSQTLDLQGSGAAGAVASTVLEWAPEDRGASEVEIRARIVSTTALLGIEPIVRWFSEIGHGDQVWREPTPVLPVIAGAPYLDYGLPARGMSWRVTSRQFRIGFHNQGTLGGAPVVRTTVQVSVLPAWGAFWPVYPYQHLAVPFLGHQQPFPITAREFKLTDLAGLPLALLAVSTTLIGLNGGLLSVQDGALYADWTPVPHLAAGITCTAACELNFR